MEQGTAGEGGTQIGSALFHGNDRVSRDAQQSGAFGIRTGKAR